VLPSSCFILFFSPSWCFLIQVHKKENLIAPQILQDHCPAFGLAVVGSGETSCPLPVLRVSSWSGGVILARGFPLKGEYRWSRQELLFPGPKPRKGTDYRMPETVFILCVSRLQPSADCGPFQGLPSFIQSIYSWIDTLSKNPGYLWVVWIYRNLIGSVHFFFILTLIVL
jgi:hypothetical protein